jgi:hypothetical protein
MHSPPSELTRTAYKKRPVAKTAGAKGRYGESIGTSRTKRVD